MNTCKMDANITNDMSKTIPATDLLLPNEQKVTMDEDTTCGFWFMKGKYIQRFANKKAYVCLYGIIGCIFSAAYAYFNGTITTLEKRFKIPSRTTGIITVGNDLSQLLLSVILSYYAGRGHRPRWMALGMYTVVMFCLLTALPHFLYGPGTDALSLTFEHGTNGNDSFDALLHQRKKSLCHTKNSTNSECVTESGTYSPQLILFAAQFISGIGGPLYYTLGVSYMDDNIKRSKTPALFSFSYFIRMLGPAIGYGLASVCLKLYISPTLTPTINNQDPRWLGAWWLGWIILGVLLFFFSTLLALFPKTLPRAAVRKELLRQISKASKKSEPEPEIKTSFKDMVKTFRRLITNPILMLNNFAAVFYFLGYMPYWIFLPKYIETQYRQSASASSLITGSAGLLFSAVGILLSGLIISRYKPRARYLAAWNVIVGGISVMGIISYAYLGCAENDNRAPLLPDGQLKVERKCNQDCNCDYVKYNPVCSQDGETSFISACHAGCTQVRKINGTDIFSDCSCITTNKTVQQQATIQMKKSFIKEHGYLEHGFAKSGSCQVDCLYQFYIFLVVVCLLKFSGATGRASNFLVTVRCVEEKDKPVAMGFGLMLMSLCAFVPSPILFGTILDKSCLVWGKTCTGNGNCWLYNGEALRYSMNFTAATFVLIGTLFDAGVWYFVKGLKIFDETVELELENFTTN
ncbi:solute carrier organic anion transporter family member 74D [Aethina tumida]|uniref:solute carrier organic anion transporter family member 74D n=1 Tax=Aethina tumida TaxID=116153 RepID=UPI00096B5E7F|nr:solute carrier organic anion transporter family member 74D [Aethina tumida]XP_049817076.1 solute carrier organic anion transporter family member 74D [Aethina tumida]XP_049817077.1 solute carrier organic anion transporter family member 74D [Aethina tumida]